MTSEVDRQAVLKVTKVRKYLKQDGSWIHTSQVDTDTRLQQTGKSLVPVNLSSAESSPVSVPITSFTQSPASTSPSSTPQRTYIQSALRKFEAFSSTENTPVRSKVKSPHPHLEESGSANVKGAVSEPTEISVEEALKTSKITPEEKENETPADTPTEKALETSKVIPVEEAFEIPADTPLEKELKVFEASSDTPLEEALETEVTPVEEAVEIPADIPVEQELETSKVTNVVKAAEIPPDNPAEATVETFIITSVHESLKTSLDTPPKVLLETSRGALKEETVNALDNSPAEPPGQLLTDNGINSTDDLVTTEIVHTVETTPEPRHAEYEPTEATNEYGEFSLQSALETPYTQPSVRVSTNESSLRPRLIVNVKMCSLCKQPINGNVKITVEDPAICCHPECFKCDDCSKPLGDLLSSMYHHAGRVLCERCFDDVFFTP